MDDSSDALVLASFAEQAYLDYAVSVVRGRALPEVSDGQKPVQRRILYAMDAMGLAAGARPVKSARVVGDVLGKYHPHGDQAAYDALVRMAQDFVLRYPLIDGQGNFGSRDGDNAAAMRYTEARLTPFARLLLEELHEGTTEFVSNYDGSHQEPASLPARLPVMLLNGASGIAVGMACEIPSHNLREIASACVALLKKPELSDADLLALVPGPDFPGGGQIISSPEDILSIYKSGKGSLKARARWHFEDLARGQWQLVVTELPPATSAQKILESIESLTNPKPRAGKKSISSEQQQTKTMVLGLLDGVRDESDKDHPVRLVFEPRSSRQSRDELINMLLVRTGLEGNVAVNLVCIDTDGRPGLRSLREVLLSWLQFRRQTITLRTRHRLDKVLDRIHVLEGRQVVYLNVDAVIKTIREADDPKAALMAQFDLSARQAEDILEMRLRQLAKLEGIRIEQELEKRRGERDELATLLQDPKAFLALMTAEIKADAKTFGDARRTLIQAAEKAVLDSALPDEPVSVIVSNKGWLRLRQGHGHDSASFGFKSGDSLYGVFECRSTHDLIALSDTGRSYSVAIAGLPSARGDGQPISSMIALAAGSKIVHLLAADPKERVLLGASDAYGFWCSLADLNTRQSAGKQFINIGSQASLLPPLLLRDTDTHIALLSASGRFLVVPIQELKQLPAGGRGTIMMGLDSGDKIAQWVAAGASGVRLRGVYRNREQTLDLSMGDLLPYLGKRARKGKPLDFRIKQASLWPTEDT